jgi:hypothetical protein
MDDECSCEVCRPRAVLRLFIPVMYQRRLARLFRYGGFPSRAANENGGGDG